MTPEQGRATTFQTKPLTFVSECVMCSETEAPQGAGIAPGYGALETTPETANPNYPHPLRRAELKAIRVQVLDSVSGNTLSYSGLHITRLVKQGKAYVTTDGQTVLGVPPVDPEYLHGRHFERPTIDRRVFRRNQRAVDLWPVLPHPAGRGIGDFLESEARK